MDTIPTLARLLRWYSLHSPLRRGSYRLALWLYQHTTIPDTTVDVTLDRTLRLSLHLKAWVDWNIYCLGMYEANLARFFLRTLRPDSIVMDVGAYIGQYTLLAAKYAPRGRIVAIEAHTHSFNRLQNHVSRNNLPNVELLNLAAGAKVGKMAFALSSDASTSGLVSPKESSWRQTVTVDVAPLDEIATQLRLGRVCLVKVDVEGGEGEVLRGAQDLLQHHRPVWIIEIDREREAMFEDTPEEIVAHLRHSGYGIYVLGRTGLSQLGDSIPDYENLIAIPYD